MKNEVKVLKLLLENKERKYTIKQIAESLNMNYRIAYEKTSQLEKDRLINITKAGNAKSCEFSYRFDSRVFIAESERRDKLFKNKDFLVLYKRLAELQFLFIALLFGSYAKKSADNHSDIDIMAIGGDKKEISSALSLWPEKIHLTYLRYKDFIHMAKSREFTVVSEAIKNNIILIGIDEYYRLLEKCLMQKE